MGGPTTSPINSEDKPASGPDKAKSKGDSILSSYMKPNHKRMSRMLGYTLTLGNVEAWAGFRFVSMVRMTEAERACLAWFSLSSLEPENCDQVAQGVYRSAGWPLPAFLGGMEDARFWASMATVNELKAYALAAFQAMPAKEQSAFFRFINSIEVPA